jgi:hypothetical protein
VPEGRHGSKPQPARLHDVYTRQHEIARKTRLAT